MRRAIPVLLAFALAVPGLGATAPAVADPAGASIAPAAVASTRLAAPKLKVAYGDESITLDWAAVPGARSYLVEWGTKSTLSGAKKGSTGKTHVRLKGLKNDVRYYVRVTAVAAKSSDNGRSSIKSAVPDSGYPRELTVTITPAGKDQVTVSWTGQGRATKVGVIAAGDASFTFLPFHTGWYRATTTSVTVTVPAKYRAQLGTGSGNPIFVKVATYNEIDADDSMPIASNGGKSYRLSPAGTYANAGVAAPSGEPLRVATWNVNTASASLPGATWKLRRTKVVAGILLSGASLLATQEATTTDAGLGYPKRQWEDLRDLLAPHGFLMANENVGPSGGATKGSHLFYKSDVAEVVDAGIVSMKSLGVSWPSAIIDRYFSWAEFELKSTGARFFAISAHLPPDDGAAYDALRVRVALAIARYVEAKAGELPVVYMGDLNAHLGSAPSGPAAHLVARGYYDASATLKRANIRYSTVNHTGQIDNLTAPGYPITPYKRKYAASRIDYILTRNAPGAWRYANQVALTPEGKFDPRYQGSDHNLQWADIGIPAS